MSSIFADRLEKFMENSGLSYRSSGQSYILDCPICGKKNKLYIRRDDGKTTCFRCAGSDNDPGGKPEFVLATMLNTSVGDVSRHLYDWVPDPETKGRIAMSQLFGSQSSTIETTPPLPLHPMPEDSYDIEDRRAVRGATYLAGRGVPADIAAQYQIRYHPARRHVLFPIIVDGRLVGYQTRMIEKQVPYERRRDDGTLEMYTPPKALTMPKGLQKERALMFHDRLIGSKHAILHEGPVSSLKAHLCGGNTATMGKAISAAQIELVRTAGCRRIYLGHDADAIEAAARLIRDGGLEEAYHMPVPHGYGDHGDMPMEEVLEVFHSAQRVFSTNVFIHLL